MSDFTVNMNEYLPLRDLVFNTLRQAILKGELKPGERLMEIQLAEKLGVSRTPIREAIRKLELEGLVIMIPAAAPRLPAFHSEASRMCSRSVVPSRSLRLTSPVSGSPTKSCRNCRMPKTTLKK